MDLYSINYLHFGANKIWYSIPEKESGRFESLAKELFPFDYKQCDQFLRHKSYLFSPSLLHANNITVNTITQHPGEFMITFPRVYHFGFNCGFNCAEAVNFALEDWINFGKKAKICLCSTDSPRIPMEYFNQLSSTTNTNQPINPINPLPISQFAPLLNPNNLPPYIFSMDPIVDPEQYEKNMQHFTQVLENKIKFDENNNDAVWTINCSCGLKQIHSSTSIKTISNCKSPVISGVLFECVGCFSWCHVECFPQYKNVDPLPINMFCQECIKSLPQELQNSTNIITPTSPQNSNTTNTTTITPSKKDSPKKTKKDSPKKRKSADSKNKSSTTSPKKTKEKK